MKAFPLILVASVILSISAAVSAQTLPRRCATMEQDSILRARFPQRGTLDEFEQQLQVKIKEREIALKNGRIQSSTITIPIVVHVIHNGEAVGTGANISQAQIQSQIAVLNEDFRRLPGSHGYNNNPVGADIGIEFCLSPYDQNGNLLSEPGIDRRKGSQSSYARTEIDGALKPKTIWNPNLFFNVWTLKFGGADSNLLGYAQFPDQSGLSGLDPVGGSASTDGVVILYSSFGSAEKGTFPVMKAPYNLGRTLSHETGHWLGLRHIWGDGVCADDFVADTPTQKGPSSGCPNPLSQSCNGTTPALVQNYMDYSDDACMNIFTNGQKSRILAVLDLCPRRKSVYQSNLCSPAVADKPTPNFTSDRDFVLLGGDVTYNDLSTNFPTSLLWTFEGGDPNTSTLTTPRVKYTTPGQYNVSLKATNKLGSADTTITGYITVSSHGICSTYSNYNDTTYTSSVLKLFNGGTFKGYLVGHNATKMTGFSELMANKEGYSYISGISVKFGHLVTNYEDSTITLVVWNARGPQGAPGSVVESKTVLLKQIKDDIANDRPTTIFLDRTTPVFSRPYHVGVLIDYTDGDSLAISSSANGESTTNSSWYQEPSGTWERYSQSLGVNVALDITAIVGVNPSTQISASRLVVNPGQEVILNGNGASIFVWNSDDGSINNVAGPQLIVRPLKTTTYTLSGSGLTLCDSTAKMTIYTTDVVSAVEPQPLQSLRLYPNPGTQNLHVEMSNSLYGTVEIKLRSAIGAEVLRHQVSKSKEDFSERIQTEIIPAGLYVIEVSLNGHRTTRKWVKIND